MDSAHESVPQRLLIDDLPNELLLGIFRHVDSKHLGNVTSVSKRWRAIVDEVIGRRLFIGRQCQFVPHDNSRFVHTYVDTFEITKVGIRECFVGEIVEPTINMPLWSRILSAIRKMFTAEAEYPEFKYPYLLETIHFDGPLPSEYFHSFVNDAMNLSRLEIHVTAFCLLQPASLQQLGQTMKNLKEISIWGHKLTDGLFTTFYNPQPIVPNIVAFISNTFQSLSFFGIEYPFDIQDNKPLTRELFDFLKRHCVHLATLRICVNIRITEEPSEMDALEDMEWIRDMRSVSRQLQLASLELIVSSMRRVRLTKIWMAFAEHQRCLTSATVLSFRVPSSILSTLCENNKNSLTSLFVSRILMTNENTSVIINGAVIGQCQHLQQLTIEGMVHNPSQAGLVNTQALPMSLVKLEIGGLILNHLDAHDLFFQLPNLTHICLTDIGNQGMFGVQLETLRQVITSRRIFIVNLYRAVCRPFPDTGIHNGDPNRRCVIRQRPYEILEMKLNSDGFYENNYTHGQVDEEDE